MLKTQKRRPFPIRLSFLLLAMGLLLTPTARAATLHTAVIGNWERAPAILCPPGDPLCDFAPLPRIASGSVTCTAVNVGNRARDVTLSILSSRTGAVATRRSCPDLPSGAVCATDPDLAFATAAYSCRIEFTGSKSTVRGALSVSTPHAIRNLPAQ